ncbi:MAG: WbqC family protein [Chitinophagales bacterium]|nr:WbqC family protein [Chitinophagales bacterium]
MKTIAIHQPNYLPWLGYFHKIAHSDIFVFLDDVEFSKQSFTRRVHIRKSKWTQERSYLIVPLQQHSDYTLINELKIDHSQNWQQKQLHQIKNTYFGTPVFEKIYTVLKMWMDTSTQYALLSDWNQFLIQSISDVIGIKTAFVRSSELPVNGKASEYNLKIVQYLNGCTYLSGKGGKKYQKEKNFRTKNIRLQYSNFSDTPYLQKQGKWLGGLSVIDGLMNGVEIDIS